jgi:hypothetical protein
MIRRIRTLARLELLDGLRNRRQLVVRALTPLVLLLALVGLTAGGGGSETDAGTNYAVAIEGPAGGSPGLLDALTAFDGGRLTLEPSEDAALAVAGSADAGLVLADGNPPTLVSDATSSSSRAAAALVRAALTAQAMPLAPGLVLTVTDVEEEEQLTTAQELLDPLGQAMAGLVLIQGGVLAGMASARVAGRRATGALVPHLLLPISRRDLVLGRAVAEEGLGLLTALPILALLAVMGTLVLTIADEAARIPAVLVALPLAAALIGFPLIATGLLIGIRARSGQQASALTAGSFVAVAIAARFVALNEEPAQGLTAAIPLVGPAQVLRGVVTGAVAPGAVVLAIAGTAAVGWALVALAARALDREHVALRSS